MIADRLGFRRFFTAIIIIFFPALSYPSANSIIVQNGSMSVKLDSGWRFLFAGDDSSTNYVMSVEEDSLVSVNIPHVFPAKTPFSALPKGFGWYFRTLTIPDSFAGKDIFLEFEGVCLYADVFINGALVYKNTFAYMPFSLQLNQYLKENPSPRIAVRVDSRLHRNRIPDTEAKGWRIYGGICREVLLTAKPAMRIDSLQVRTIYRRSGSFELKCRIPKNGKQPWDSVIVSMTPQNENKATARFRIVDTNTSVTLKNVHSWSPEDPFRYRLVFIPYFGATPGAATVMFRGFCQLTVKGTRLFLNGKPCHLRGMARHDFIGLDGSPPSREQRLADLTDMKSLGVNFLRIAHFPQHRDVYELCDSIGLIVMDEMPAWKTDPKFLGSPAGREYGAAYMRELINIHGNYTSVCLWSIGNQFKSYKTSVADFVGEVAKAVKRADPSRMVTFCSYYYFWDKAFSYLDVISVNEYFGWELASLEMLTPMLDKINREWPKKPVLVSELGAQAKLGLRNRDARLAGPIKSMLGKDISEDHQALYIGAHMDSIRTRCRFVGGMVVWAYGDYMADLDKKRTSDMPQGINACGIVTADRKRKMAYETVKARYTAWSDPKIRCSEK